MTSLLSLMALSEKKGRIWLPDNYELQKQIMQEFHASPIGGHSGIPVTLRRLKQLFAWKGMNKCVQRLVQSCTV